MRESQIKWVIFTVALFLFPAIFYLFVDIAILPITYVGLRIILPAISAGDFSDALILLVPCLFWVAIIYYSSKWLSHLIDSNDEKKYIFMGIILLVMALLAISPIYDKDLVSLKEKSSAFFLYVDLI